jgi:hypothetical protein
MARVAGASSSTTANARVNAEPLPALWLATRTSMSDDAPT